jgi:hypothetical protein
MRGLAVYKMVHCDEHAGTPFFSFYEPISCRFNCLNVAYVASESMTAAKKDKTMSFYLG